MKQMSSLVIAFIVLTVLVFNCHAKRGCAVFGHSCFGGHGKRSEISPADENFNNKALNTMNDLSKEYPFYLNTITNVPDYEGNNIAPERDWKYNVYTLIHRILTDAKNNRQNAVLSPSSSPNRFDSENM